MTGWGDGARTGVRRADRTGRRRLHPRGGSRRRLPSDTVIVAGAVEPNTELYEKLVAALPDTHIVAAGDCTGAGLIRKATEDGARAACTI